MKDKQMPLMLLGVMAGMQYFCYYQNPFTDIALPFVTDLTAADTASGNFLMILYGYLPIPFLLILFSGDMRQLLCGYGLLLSIRGEKRNRMLLRMMGKTPALVFGSVFLAGAVYEAGRKEVWERLSLEQIIWALGLYALAVCTLIQLQYLLELYADAQYALATAVIGGALSLFVSGCVREQNPWLDSLLFFNLAFAEKNGVLETERGTIDSLQALVILGAIYLLISVMTLKIYRKRDMI